MADETEPVSDQFKSFKSFVYCTTSYKSHHTDDCSLTVVFITAAASYLLLRQESKSESIKADGFTFMLNSAVTIVNISLFPSFSFRPVKLIQLSIIHIVMCAAPGLVLIIDFIDWLEMEKKKKGVDNNSTEKQTVSLWDEASSLIFKYE